MPRHHRGLPLVVCCAAALAAAPAHSAAQLVRGTVVERESQQPIASAAITLERGGRVVRSVTSDNTGRFIVRLPEPGSYRLSVTHIGYSGAASRLPDVGEREELSVAIELSTDPVELPPVRVTGRRPAGARFLDGFFDRAASRRSRNDGRVLTRADLDQMFASQPTDYLRHVPGLQLQQVPVGRERMPVFHRLGESCVPAVYLNGGRIAAYDIDTFVRPGTLEGIEVYNQGDEPAEYWDRDGCGVILVWTQLRAAGDPMDRRRLLILTGLAAFAGLTRLLMF